MPLVFVAITPHPPIIVPGVGNSDDLRKCQSTVSAMKKLARSFADAKVDTIVIMSPHSPSTPKAFTVNVAPELKSSLTEFGVPKPEYTQAPNTELIGQITEDTSHTEIQIAPIENSALDHGVNVPLHYLLQANSDIKLVSLGYTDYPPAGHFSFGQQLSSILDEAKDRVAFIASGDLSHRLTAEAPAGFSPRGKEFDEQIVKAVKEYDLPSILSANEELIQEAGECGLRSIATLLGVVDQQKSEPEILSYEGPFGVGYLVANFKLN
ncbi:AmmeMemoRadiSam system protein B [Patescibacteria group bacterium]